MPLIAMPRVPKWEPLVQRRDIIDGRIFLNNLSPHEKESRKELKCVMYPLARDNHKMVHELLLCCWSACTDCKWQGKVLTCPYAGAIYVFERYTHNTSEPEPYPITPWYHCQDGLTALRQRFQDEVEQEFGKRFEIESTTPACRGVRNNAPTQGRIVGWTPQVTPGRNDETVAVSSMDPHWPSIVPSNRQLEVAYHLPLLTPPLGIHPAWQHDTVPNVMGAQGVNTHATRAVIVPRPTQVTELRYEDNTSVGRAPKRARTEVEGFHEAVDQSETQSDMTTTHTSVTNQAKTTTKSADGEVVVNQSASKGDEGENDPFTSTWLVDMNGEPIVGKGWDESPFLVGVSTKALLRRPDRDPPTFVLHVDPSLRSKFNYNAVVSIGIADFAGPYHLVAVFVVLDTTEAIYLHHNFRGSMPHVLQGDEKAPSFGSGVRHIRQRSLQSR